MPIAKAMDDCIVAYGMNGEAVRPQNGFPLRLMVPGFEGIFHTKWLRRIKVVDRYYMNYNDFGHLDRIRRSRRSTTRSDPSRSSRSRPADNSCPAAASTRSAAWPGPAAAPSSRWRCPPTAARSWNKAEIKGTPQRMAHARFGYQWNWDGQRDRAPVALHGRDRSGATVARADRQVLEQALRCDIQRAGAGQQHSAVEDRQRWERAPMGSLRVLPFALLMGVSALAQSPTYGVGRTPTAEEIRALGYLHRSDRRGTPAGARNRQGGRAGLSREGVRRMPRGDGHRGHGARF